MTKSSILPIVESVVSVILYFVLAIQLDTHIPLVISILAAPLLLLRSNTSTRAGAVAFYRYITSDSDIRFKTRPILFSGLFVLILTTIFYLSYIILTLNWLQIFAKNKYQILMSIGFFLPIIGSWAGIAILSGLVGIRAGYLAGLFSGKITQSGVSDTLSIVTMMNAKDLISVVNVGCQSAQVGATYNVFWKFFHYGFILFLLVQKFNILEVISVVCGIALFEAAIKYFNVLSTVIFGISIGTGIWVRSIVTRVYISLKFICLGFRRLPFNFRQIMLVKRLFSEPEVVPGINRKADYLSAKNIKNHIGNSSLSSPLQVLLILALSITYVPAVLYRLSLKSTLWFYYILAFWGSSLKRSKVSAEAYLVDLHGGRLELLSRVTAITVLASALITNTNIGEFMESKTNFPEIPIFVRGLLAIDFCQLPLWHIFSLGGAFITIAIFFYSDIVNNRLEVDKRNNSSVVVGLRKVNQLALMGRLRRIFTILFFITVFAYLLLNSDLAIPNFVYLVVPEFILEVIRQGEIFSKFSILSCAANPQ